MDSKAGRPIVKPIPFFQILVATFVMVASAHGQLTITTSSPLPTGTVGVAYYTTLNADGGTTPYTWSVCGGAFPPGLYQSDVPTIDGTPRVASNYYFNICVTDKVYQATNKWFYLTINPAPVTWTITTSASPPAGGSTTGGGSYTNGQSVTVTATVANSCYTFANWTQGGIVVSTSASYSFTASTNRTLVANFTQITYTVNTSSSPTNGGTTTGGGSYACGSSATVSATPASNYIFVNWTHNGTVVSTSSSYTFTVSAGETLVANFEPGFTITTSSSPAGSGSTSGGGTYTSGSMVTVTATASSCYTFASWTQGDTVVSTSASYSFTASANRALVANFTQVSYAMVTSSSPPAGGSTSGGGSYACGTSVTVCAMANPSYGFVNWTVNGNVVSTSECCTFTAASSETLAANFVLFQITSISLTNTIDLFIAWNTCGTNNIVQVSAGTDASGSFSTNGFTDLTNIVVTTATTNFWDVGAATNSPARYYRIRSPR
jgi:hypothetical protein